MTFVGRYTKDKNDQPLVSKKTGKPYTSLRIKCNEYGDKYLSGFDGPATQSWKEGDTVEVEVKPNGEYLNFEVPRTNKGGGMSPEQFQMILQAIRDVGARIEKKVDDLRTALEAEGVLTARTTDGGAVPDFTPKTMNEDTREVPPITEEELAGVF